MPPPHRRWVRTEAEARARDAAREAAAAREVVRRMRADPVAFAAQVAACAEEERICGK